MAMHTRIFLMSLFVLLVSAWGISKAAQQDRKEKHEALRKQREKDNRAQALFQFANQQSIKDEKVEECWHLVLSAIRLQELTLKGIMDILELNHGPEDSQVFFIDLMSPEEGKQAPTCSVTFISDTHYCDSAAMRLELSRLWLTASKVA
jgi:hypothetical protein